VPHRLLRAIGLARFWAQNAAVTIFAIVALTLCAWRDHSFFLKNGFGYFQHPGIFGWYLIQLIMPVAIYATLKAATRSAKRYRELMKHGAASRFRELVFNPPRTRSKINSPQLPQERVVSLGVFYEDSIANKRWVLKSADASTLEQIDAVFVTEAANGLAKNHCFRFPQDSRQSPLDSAATPLLVDAALLTVR